MNALKFIKAGKAFFTVTSRKTGKRFTYKVSTPKGKQEEGPWFVSLLTGQDNENDYKFFGTLFADGSYRYSVKKARLQCTAPGVMAWDWFFEKLTAGTHEAQCEVHHCGKCGRCGRKLTVPQSIESGFGPECAGMV